MNSPFRPPLEAVDEMLMDVALLVQLTPAKHDRADQHFTALCQHVDREGSPLQGRVIRCYPSGSFATGTAILSHVATSQHDVDVVIELDLPASSQPSEVVTMLYQAINGPSGSRYNGRVRQNSRCVTVTYEDDTKVDLMPIVRLVGQPERAGVLFHFKKDTKEEYHKPVNPWGFADYFNSHAEESADFTTAFDEQRRVLEKALTDPLPDHVPATKKSPRIVAIQLAKRARDIAYRRHGRKWRKPPSIILAALSLEMGPVQPRLIDELIALTAHLRARISAQLVQGELLTVCNPAYPADVFSDRWPENRDAMALYRDDLRVMETALLRLRDQTLTPERIKSELEQVFGESVAVRALNEFLDKRRKDSDAGRMAFGAGGRVLTGAAALASTATMVRGSTFEGDDPPSP